MDLIGSADNAHGQQSLVWVDIKVDFYRVVTTRKMYPACSQGGLYARGFVQWRRRSQRLFRLFGVRRHA